MHCRGFSDAPASHQFNIVLDFIDNLDHRIYALTKKHKAVLAFSTIILLWQWAIALYAMSQVCAITHRVSCYVSNISTVSQSN